MTSKIRSIQEVQETYEDQLMKLKGIEGIGITTRNGEECLIIYTDKKSRKIKLTGDLADYSVVFEYMGSVISAYE